MMYIQQQEGLGNIFKKVLKVVQTIDPVSHAVKEAGLTKTTIGKILVPTAINVDKPKVTFVANATSCAVAGNKSNAACISFLNTQSQKQDTTEIVSQQTVGVANTKTYLVVGAALLVGATLVILANR